MTNPYEFSVPNRSSATVDYRLSSSYVPLAIEPKPVEKPTEAKTAPDYTAMPVGTILRRHGPVDALPTGWAVHQSRNVRHHLLTWIIKTQ